MDLVHSISTITRTRTMRHDDLMMKSGFIALFWRDLQVYSRSRGAWLNPLLFILLSITLFAFGMDPDSTGLTRHAAGVVWVVALLGIMLSLESIFRSDYDDGSLEQMLLSPEPLYFLVLAKSLAHWLVCAFPMILASPLLILMTGLPMSILPELAISLLLGTGTLCFLGAIGAALTVSLRSGGLLLALIILPLYVPVIIFGARYLQGAIDGISVPGALLMLMGLLIAAITLAPLAIIGGLKISVDS